MDLVKNSWSTNYNKKYQWNFPSINKSLIISLILIIIIGILSYFNFTTGNYARILETNKTALEDQLRTLNNQTQCLAQNLSACNINLNTCNNVLTSKSTSLLNCQNEKNGISSSLSDCNQNLGVCESRIDAYGNSLNSCSSDLDYCNNAKSALRDNYARDYCCLMNKTHYTINNNRISCVDSGGTSISC